MSKQVGVLLDAKLYNDVAIYSAENCKGIISDALRELITLGLQVHKIRKGESHITFEDRIKSKVLTELPSEKTFNNSIDLLSDILDDVKKDKEE